ncbi:hypothetical protein [Vibrio fluvialis]|uniref:hypothetical protein n=1 Tax=Vibrio fluvialis TaxID=676 RepID=UPI0028DFC31D|nr:hypothetical protein [Vibrio fluvialis]MDT8869194.1 hypothetical protein [Vibrio fluvialis]MDT8876847.1 hypothetical protein [Vibrio fluvialis]
MKKLLMVLVGAISTSAVATPAINIGAMHSFIEADRSTLLKQIRNNGSSTAFVQITAMEIKYTEDGTAKEVEIDREALLRGEGTGLIVSPARMIVPVSGGHVNRMLTIGERDVERYYRVRFIPVVPDSAMSFGLTDDEADTYRQELNAGVNVMAGYGSIVVVRPSDVHFNTDIVEDTHSVTVSNNGNTTVVLDAFAKCEAKQQNCGPHVVHFLRPGKSMTQNFESGRSFQFTLVEGASKTKLAFGQL